MIALQEEMDWLVYRADGLLPETSAAIGRVTPCAPSATATGLSKLPSSAIASPSPEGAGRGEGGQSNIPPLQEPERPFRLWAKANGDFSAAISLIPSHWSQERCALWEARLAAIRDNEHIRRIEPPGRRGLGRVGKENDRAQADQNVRGKLNVPRERFRQRKAGYPSGEFAEPVVYRRRGQTRSTGHKNDRFASISPRIECLRPSRTLINSAA